VGEPDLSTDERAELERLRAEVARLPGRAARLVFGPSPTFLAALQVTATAEAGVRLTAVAVAVVVAYGLVIGT
jgi:hypothetical protein